MIKFNKVKESIENFDTRCHFLVRVLKSSQDFSKYSDSEIIDEIIKSKFHHWRGEEEPNGLSISLSINNKNKTLENYKFYGFFDNDKLSSSNYKKVAFEDFRKMIMTSISEFTDGDSSFELKVQNIIIELNSRSIFYHLDLSVGINPDLVAEWTTYSLFTAFISIDRKNSSAALIEFGQD